MNVDNLKSKIGMQIGFLLHSDAPDTETIDRLTNIAVDFAIKRIDSCLSEDPFDSQDAMKREIIALKSERV